MPCHRELNASTVETPTTSPKFDSESHKSQQVKANETKYTAQEATDLPENAD